MIKLSRLADYAVVLLTHMAHTADPQNTQDTSLRSAQYLASQSGLSLPTVSKILKALVKAELLRSVRGAQGGYTLARPASQITVSEIVEAVDGPIAITDCMNNGAQDCHIEHVCPTRAGWKKLNRAVRDALASVSLADIMPPGMHDVRLHREPATATQPA